MKRKELKNRKSRIEYIVNLLLSKNEYTLSEINQFLELEKYIKTTNEEIQYLKKLVI